MSDDDDEETFDDVTEVHRFFRPLAPPLLELISDFSDGGKWFEFKWVI